MSQSVSVEGGPQFRALGERPARLRELVEQRIGPAGLCQSLSVGGGRFLVMYSGVGKGDGDGPGDGPGIYKVDIGKKVVDAWVLGRPTWLRLVQDRADVSWMLMTAQKREGQVISNLYYALVFWWVEAEEGDGGQDIDMETGRVVSAKQMGFGISKLVEERYLADDVVVSGAGVDFEVRVEGYEVVDVDGDEYPDIRFDVVEKELGTGAVQRRRVRFVYSEGGLNECCVAK